MARFLFTMLPTNDLARESNARWMASLGVGEFIVPSLSGAGQKHLDIAEFKATVERVLREPWYHATARRISEAVARYGGAREAANRIEAFAAGLHGSSEVCAATHND
jgi:UDP:flavonoid glycosyltransferase YjiC (YdhE family)